MGNIDGGAINGEVGGEPVVVFTATGGLTVTAFSRNVDGQSLNFEYAGDGRFTDQETGTSWDFAGRGGDGPLSGNRLERVSTRRSFWFAVAIAFPGSARSTRMAVNAANNRATPPAARATIMDSMKRLS